MEHIVILVGSLGIVAYLYSKMPEEKAQSDAWKDGYPRVFLPQDRLPSLDFSVLVT